MDVRFTAINLSESKGRCKDWVMWVLWTGRRCETRVRVKHDKAFFSTANKEAKQKESTNSLNWFMEQWTCMKRPWEETPSTIEFHKIYWGWSWSSRSPFQFVLERLPLRWCWPLVISCNWQVSDDLCGQHLTNLKGFWYYVHLYSCFVFFGPGELQLHWIKHHKFDRYAAGRPEVGEKQDGHCQASAFCPLLILLKAVEDDCA